MKKKKSQKKSELKGRAYTQQRCGAKKFCRAFQHDLGMKEKESKTTMTMRGRQTLETKNLSFFYFPIFLLFFHGDGIKKSEKGSVFRKDVNCKL